MRGNCLGAEAGIKGMVCNNRGEFGGIRHDARAMRTAQHLSEREVERA